MGRILTIEQNEFINLHLQGRNITDIAKKIGKSRTTIYKWLEWPEIQNEIEKRKEEMKKAAKSKIIGQVDSCIDIMLDLAHNSKDNRTRFAATKYLLDQGIGAPSTSVQDPISNNKVCKKPINIDETLAEIKRNNGINEDEELIRD